MSGKNVHDARLTAAMIKHKISHLLTFNVKDFKRFVEIILAGKTNNSLIKRRVNVEKLCSSPEQSSKKPNIRLLMFIIISH
ncbi:MAG TPA: hypothetical protein VK892_22995 [Pyrinomonadaceae bacterium]|nr:hypothetical protein [Pyrinomonadaceae bacterium]